MRQLHRGICALCATLLMAMIACSSGAQSYTWDNVAIGGGGYTNQCYIHPQNSNLIYVGTDIGGMYRWIPSEGRLKQLIHRADEDSNLYGCAGIGLHPTNQNVLYYGGGKYRTFGPHALMKSMDQGETWSQYNLPSGAAFDVNNGSTNWRFGRKIVVNPANPAQVFVGTSTAGLYRANFSSDTSLTAPSWTQITSIPTGSAVNAIVFDPTNSNYVYVATYGGGVYRSSNNGGSFSQIGSSTFNTLDMDITASGDNLLLATDGQGIRRLDNPRTGSSFAVPSGTNSGGEYRGIECSETDNNVVITCPNAFSSLGSIILSTNAGDSFSSKSGTMTKHIPWHPNWAGSAISHYAFDPNDGSKVYFTDWYSFYRTDNIFASTVSWRNDVGIGHEEVVSLGMKGMITNSNGVLLLSGHADVTGFAHTALRTVPSTNFSGGGAGGATESMGMDQAPSNPNVAYLIGTAQHAGTTGAGYRSTNAGKNWSAMSGYSSSWGSGKVAVSNNNADNIVVATKAGGVQYSTNGGASFAAASGAPTSSSLGISGDVWSASWRDILVGDRGQNSTFFLYNLSNGGLYRSTNSGANWSQVTTFTTTSNSRINIQAVPGRANHIWAALHDKGLWRYNGTSASQITAFKRAIMCAVGAPQTSGGYPAVYVYGSLQADSTMWIYRSTDEGATWTRINNESSRVGNSPQNMTADPSVFGRVYIGTNGSGVWYGAVSGDTNQVAAPTFSPAAGTYASAQSVTISSATSGATIRYTTDGSNPTSTSGTVYSGPITISSTTTLKAIAYKSGMTDSSVTSGTYTISQPDALIVGGTPTIDGTIDGVWGNANSYSLGNTLSGSMTSSDLSASWRSLWDSTNLYLLAEVTDDAKRNDSTNAWDDDSIEWYVDGNNDKASSYDSNDRQYIFGWNDSAVVEGGGRNSTGVTFTKADPTSTSYRIEAKAPWSAIGATVSEGKLIGIDMHVNDDDDGAGRDGKKSWHATVDSSWQNPSLFATGRLDPSGGPTPPSAPTNLTATAGNAQVDLSWSASSGANSYNVKRSTTSGSGYSTVGTSTDTSHTDSSLTNGTTYYYVVTAVNTAGESGNSNQASATPSGGQVAAPTFSPAAGTYTSAQSVTISTATSGASIRYTTDGSNPTSTTGTLYSGPVSISVTTTLKAIAYKSGMTDSSVTSGTYTIDTGSSGPTITAGTITVDGTVDSAWSNATALSVNNVSGTINSSSDLSATWKAMWDSTNLYALVEVTDDDKRNDSTNPWEDDSVEWYVDGANNKATSYDTNDRQYVFGWNDTAATEGGGRNLTGVSFSKADPTTTSYRIEAKMPWTSIGLSAAPASGSNVGIDVHVNDDDGGAGRDGKKMWNDTTDGAWSNPSLFGTAQLTGTPPGGGTESSTHQAEDGTVSGGAVSTSFSGYTGSGYVDYGGSGSYVEWTDVSRSAAGTVTLTFRYANGSTVNRSCNIIVNGTQVGTVSFAPVASDWSTWGTATIDVSLNAGSNTLRVTANSSNGGPNLDKVDVSN